MKRARTQRRSAERARQKEVEVRRKLFQASEGGTPDRPILVSSASVIEARARDLLCPVCGGQTSIRQHEAVRTGVKRLRKIERTCMACGEASTLYFELALPN